MWNREGDLIRAARASSENSTFMRGANDVSGIALIDAYGLN